jgi:FtsH-binding integral membrane protein
VPKTPIRTWRSFTRPVFLWALCALLTQIVLESLGKIKPQLAHSWMMFLPVIPAIAFVIALSRAVQKMDELQKRICLESVFIAFLLTTVLAFIVGGLDQAGIYHAKSDALGTPMMGFFAGAYIFSTWRYR